ncbi:CLUMA_CG011655, isoform A [Clunio marinus]|uniref:CLUMA_CG011655, isoform A n=1 Tax=Clunio marinus TaxID=568069 RepID=A0A1J1IDE7_9DIPT|nr:CLUMA_CG011655, isoform A [Clunio marinus]
MEVIYVWEGSSPLKKCKAKKNNSIQMNFPVKEFRSRDEFILWLRWLKEADEITEKSDEVLIYRST